MLSRVAGATGFFLKPTRVHVLEVDLAVPPEEQVVSVLRSYSVLGWEMLVPYYTYHHSH